MDIKTLEAHRAVEERVLNALLAERHGRIEDPNYAAAVEHADEGIALAARDLVDAVDGSHPDEWPVGWFCGKPQELPNRADGPFPMFGRQCRLRPNHDGGHDWEQQGTAERAETAVLHMLALAPDEYRQCITAARAATSDRDYYKNSGRAEMIRVFATGLAERAGMPVPDWEQIKQSVPSDGVYRAGVSA